MGIKMTDEINELVADIGTRMPRQAVSSSSIIDPKIEEMVKEIGAGLAKRRP